MEDSVTAIAAASKTTRIPREEQKNPSLPTEIIADIFSRLPAKFVFQMECLSKHYSSSLSKDPYFVQAHLRQSSRLRPSLIVQKPHGVVCLIRSDGDKITVEKVTLPPKIDYPDCHNKFKIVASCNGIVLVVIGPRCSLWNPATVTFLELPYRRLFFSKVVSWGFGYCNQSHDYKIIRIAMCMHKHPKNNFSAEIMCVNTNRVWRNVDFSGFEICDSGSGMSFNGVIYWKPTWLESGKYSILTFDLAKEKFAWIPCPFFGDIMDFKGSLAISACLPFQTIRSLWVLKDEHDVNMDSWCIHSYFDFFLDAKRPVGFLNDHQLLLQDPLLPAMCEDSEQEEYRYECSLYDFDTNKIKNIPNLFAYHREEAHYSFTESLVALPT